MPIYRQLCNNIQIYTRNFNSECKTKRPYECFQISRQVDGRRGLTSARPAAQTRTESFPAVPEAGAWLKKLTIFSIFL